MLAQSLLEMKPTAVMELNIRKGGLDRVDNGILEIMYHALNGHFSCSLIILVSNKLRTGQTVKETTHIVLTHC
jgi:hypothetical protein